MARIARRYYALVSWLHFAMDITACKTGMARAEVFDTRDGSTILHTRAFLARWICKRITIPSDFDII